jgi:hypothetical protein
MVRRAGETRPPHTGLSVEFKRGKTLVCNVGLKLGAKIYDIRNDKTLSDLQTTIDQATSYRYCSVRLRQTRLARLGCCSEKNAVQVSFFAPGCRFLQ